MTIWGPRGSLLEGAGGLLGASGVSRGGDPAAIVSGAVSAIVSGVVPASSPASSKFRLRGLRKLQLTSYKPQAYNSSHTPRGVGGLANQAEFWIKIRIYKFLIKLPAEGHSLIS